jgi:hypothetical protein
MCGNASKADVRFRKAHRETVATLSRADEGVSMAVAVQQRSLETSRPPYIWSSPGSPDAGLPAATAPLTRPFRNGEFDVASRRQVLSIRRRRHSAGFTVPMSADAADVSMAPQAGLVALCAAPRN